MLAMLTGQSRAERLGKDLVGAKLEVEKTAHALEAADGEVVRTVAAGDPKAVAAARAKKAAARLACVAAGERVDELSAALSHVADEDKVKAHADENAALSERAETNGAKAEAALAEGLRLTASGLVLLGEALARAEIAGNCERTLRQRGAPVSTSFRRLNAVVVEDSITAALDGLYPRRDARRMDETLSLVVNTSACIREE